MTFEAHAIVELMGHNKIAGRVSEQVIGGAAMLRVDVPKTERREGYTKFYSSSAVYCITPCDEATAQRAAESFNVPPISPYVLQIESPALLDKTAGDWDEYEGDEDQSF